MKAMSIGRARKPAELPESIAARFLGPIVLVLLVAKSASAAEERYPLVLDDLGATSRSGAVLVATGVRGVHRGLDEASGRLPTDLAPAAVIGLGVGRFLLADAPVAMLSTWIQHEAFGHAARAREYRLEHSISIAIPPPYGWRVYGNFVSWSTEEALALTPEERVLLISEGPASETLLLRELRHQSAASGQWRRGLAPVMWIHALGDLSRSLMHGSDLFQYRELIAQRPDTGMAGAWPFFLRWGIDPLFWWSIYDYGRGIAIGKRTAALPALRAGEIQLLPAPSLRLSPWGQEFGASMLAWTPTGLAEIELLLGPRSDTPPSFAVTAGATRFGVGGHFDLGVRIGLWRQPLLPDGPFNEIPLRPGLLTELEATIHLTRHFGIRASTGFKTRGYMPGYRMGTSVSFLGGLVLSI